MPTHNPSPRLFATALLSAVCLLSSAAAQTATPAGSKGFTVSDAQVESNVLQALAANTQLATKEISSTAVYGTVTLSGAVPDEATRTLAEQVVSRVSGVKKVVDELTLGTASGAQSSVPGAGGDEGSLPPRTSAPPEQQTADADQQGSNPNLQSDGTIAGTDAGSPGQAAMPPDAGPYGGDAGAAGQPQGPPSWTADNYPQEHANDGYPGGPPPPSAGQPAYPPYSSGAPPGSAPPSAYPQNGPPPASASQGPSYPPYGASRGPYDRPAYPPPGVNPYGRQTIAQRGGEPVTVPAGTVLQVRTMGRLDSRTAQPGSVFGAVVMNDVYANGLVAIPRGAQVTGVVSEAAASGALKGRSELALQLTSLTLEGRTFPLASDAWAHTGGDKTQRTVSSAVGLGALGAVIGGVAGGGAGAAIGAGAGAAAGLGASAALPGGQVVVPAEAILSFRLTQPTQLSAVSQAELNRLGAGVPYGPGPYGAGMRRRYPPPPPPYAYGPYAYPGYPYYPRYAPRYPYPY